MIGRGSASEKEILKYIACAVDGGFGLCVPFVSFVGVKATRA
jgi:hypothetical protein